MLLTILFPFRATYRSLDLQSRWWHRLAISVFGLFLLFLTLTFAGNRISDDLQERDRELNRATTSFMNQVATLDDSPTSSARTYELSKRYEEISHVLRRECDIRLSEDYGAAFGFCLSLSYVLQLIYRLAIYVVFGSKTQM